jgi:hypothetical protein
MKVIVAGSRWVEDFDIVKQAIEASGFEVTEVVSGVARGVDTLGENWAEANDIPVKRFPALWSKLDVPGAVIRSNTNGKYNAAAGGIRNGQMAEYGDALVSVWDGKSRGSGDMILKAHAAGIKVFVFLVEPAG